MSRGICIQDVRSVICIYFSEGIDIFYSRSAICDMNLFQSEQNVAIGVLIIHDLRSAICIYFSRDNCEWVEVCVIHDLQSAICVYFSEGSVKRQGYLLLTICDLRSVFTSMQFGGVCYSQSAICNLHLFYWGQGYLLLTICDLRSAITSVGRLWVGVSVIHDLRSAICIYFSEGRGVFVGVLLFIICDLRSAFTSVGQRGMGRGICTHDLRSVIWI